MSIQNIQRGSVEYAQSTTGREHHNPQYHATPHKASASVLNFQQPSPPLSLRGQTLQDTYKGGIVKFY